MSQSSTSQFSSTNIATVGSVPLFACTKCNSRHPFEDLSSGHQLCKDCRSSYQTLKCNYCRNEYHQEANGNGAGGGSSRSNSICKKCEQLQEQHGKPGPCAHCNIIAAFIGTKCQRCTNSENKYGPPMSCEHCKQKCAFDRKDPDSKKKVDGKLLCWLCTMAYKRTLAKARQKESMMKHVRGPGDDSQSYSSSSNRHSHGSSSNNFNGHRQTSHTNNIPGSTTPPVHRSSSHRHIRSEPNNHHHGHANRDVSSRKKQRVDYKGSSSAHQIASVPSLSDTRFAEPNNGSDLGTVVTQLKDQVAMLNKKLQIKEKEMLLKDQQIADLKSTGTREQRELREKINSLQKQHQDRISELQAKLITMQKQLVAQTRAARNTTATTFVEPSLVI